MHDCYGRTRTPRVRAAGSLAASVVVPPVDAEVGRRAGVLGRSVVVLCVRLRRCSRGVLLVWSNVQETFALTFTGESLLATKKPLRRGPSTRGAVAICGTAAGDREAFTGVVGTDRVDRALCECRCKSMCGGVARGAGWYSVSRVRGVLESASSVGVASRLGGASSISM